MNTPSLLRPRLLGLSGLVLALAPTLTFAQAGDLDPTFGTGGTLTLDFEGSSDFARAVAIQADGKLLVAGDRRTPGFQASQALARFNEDGTLDMSFGACGCGIVTSSFGGIATQMVLQPDGKILVAGLMELTGPGDTQWVVARHLPDGDLDPTFGAGGLATVDLRPGSFDGLPRALALQGSKMLVIGDTISNPSDLIVARFDQDGWLDATFGSGGLATTDLGGTEFLEDLVVLSDGTFLIAGGISDLNTFENDGVVARFGENGNLDPTFGVGGVAIVDLGNDDGDGDFLFGIAADALGRILIGGFGDNADGTAVIAARLDPSGCLDPSFGVGGRMTFGIATDVTDLFVQADGRILAAGRTGSPDTDFLLARLDDSGTLDPAFGAGAGFVRTDFLGDRDLTLDAALDANGRVVLVGGSRPFGGSEDWAIARYLTLEGSEPTIDDLVEDIEDLVESGILNEGQGNSLLAKLRAANRQLCRGNVQAARNQLEAFINEVEGMIQGGTLPPAEGQLLIDAAQMLIDLSS